MRSRRRLAAALALAVMCAPGTWFRTPVSETIPRDIALEQVAGPSNTQDPQWAVAGVWQYSVSSRYFGGFSGLLTLGGNRLRAFSDRGARFTFHEPDNANERPESRVVAFQLVDREYANDLWDLESATRDPQTGDYWLGFEQSHALHRFSVASEADGVLELDEIVDWPANTGAEAMVRLSDGRFLLIGEGDDAVLVFPSDPIKGSEPQFLAFENPADSYAVTDMTQLPDGRVLLLMRNVEWGYPPFAGLLAIAHPPDGDADAPWRPQIALRFSGVIPNENYEGLAVRALQDGRVAIWVMADDNYSVMQRSLLAKLIYDPSA